MGNIACLFWRPGGYEDEVREGRSATVDTTISADSGFVDEPTPKENSLLENLISAVRYILAKTLFNLHIIGAIFCSIDFSYGKSKVQHSYKDNME